jgi:hypothetical protein
VVGSTTQLIAPPDHGRDPFIVATDNGILHKMRMAAPGKHFIEAPTAGNSATCKSCAHCPWMAMNGLRNLADVLEATADNEIHVDPETGRQAVRAIDRMLDFAAAKRPRPCPDRRAGARNCFRDGTGMSESASIHSPMRRIRRQAAGGVRTEPPGRAAGRRRQRRPDRQAGAGEPRARARVIVREDAVLCGAPWFEGVMLAVDQDIEIDWQYAEGDLMAADSVVCTIEGRRARC